ncbi:ABC transporter permease [Dyella subtropica]|uniref:ABC transporter permease n=1 Tax=Dyella subtropica TaxID=2992127 RepID=UPI0022509E9C|nr:ABC transporter permease [Dyella subtropica]
MTIDFIHALHGEWIKKKRSLASWLIVIGAFFTPLIVIVARLVNHNKLQALYSADTFWNALWKSSWESMAIFFLPLSAILATSLMTQLEYKNNAWKQVHTLPLSVTVIFFAKLTVILLMIVQFFILFNVGIYLSALIPYLLVSGTPYPSEPLPLRSFLAQNALYFIDCLPIVAIQYLLSLRFKNFLVPIGFGFLTWVGALAALSWKFGYVVPYAYSMLNYLKDSPSARVAAGTANLHWLALGYFLLSMVAGYWLFITKTQKG